jgi:hypothetical protein
LLHFLGFVLAGWLPQSSASQPTAAQAALDAINAVFTQQPVDWQIEAGLGGLQEALKGGLMQLMVVPHASTEQVVTLATGYSCDTGSRLLIVQPNFGPGWSGAMH